LGDIRGSPNSRTDWIPAGFGSLQTEQSHGPGPHPRGCAARGWRHPDWQIGFALGAPYTAIPKAGNRKIGRAIFIIPLPSRDNGSERLGCGPPVRLNLSPPRFGLLHADLVSPSPPSARFVPQLAMPPIAATPGLPHPPTHPHTSRATTLDPPDLQFGDGSRRMKRGAARCPGRRTKGAAGRSRWEQREGRRWEPREGGDADD
jgi:hypothetical protein